MKNKIVYYLILSIVAGFLILLLAFFSSPNTNITRFFDRILIVGIATIGCLFGVSLATRPGWYRKSLHKNHGNNKSNTKKIRNRIGHHPDCDRFRSHTVTINNKKICSGCLGLAIGAIIALILMIGYLFVDIPKSIGILYLFIISGLVIIGFVYIEIILAKRSTTIHIVSNIFLMISFLLLTIGIFEITGNRMYGVITVILSFLWLDTRIQLSKWHHSLICDNCMETCKMY